MIVALYIFLAYTTLGGAAGYLIGSAINDDSRYSISTLCAIFGPVGFVIALSLLLSDVARRRAEHRLVFRLRADQVAQRKHEIEMAALDEELREVKRLGGGAI